MQMFTMERRAFLIALFAGLCAPTAAAAKPRGAPTILFVCQYGTVKSPIARELFRRAAAQRGVPVSVVSRGITPEEHLSADVRERLTHEGIDLASDPLHKLTQTDLDRADLVVLFDKLPASFIAANVHDWTDLPSVLNDYAQARTELDRRIGALFQRIFR